MMLLSGWLAIMPQEAFFWTLASSDSRVQTFHSDSQSGARVPEMSPGTALSIATKLTYIQFMNVLKIRCGPSKHEKQFRQYVLLLHAAGVKHVIKDVNTG